MFQAVQLVNFPACPPFQLQQASAVLPRIRFWLSNLSIKFLDFAQGQVERSETWPCAKSKNFMLKFFFPPRRRSPKQPSRSAKKKIKKNLFFGRQLSRFWARNPVSARLTWPKSVLIQPDCYELRFLQGGSYPSLVFIHRVNDTTL